jgi:hypothetical protein
LLQSLLLDLRQATSPAFRSDAVSG